MTDAKVDRIIYESWCHALNEMKSISEELADVEIYHYPNLVEKAKENRDKSSKSERRSRMDALQSNCAVHQNKTNTQRRVLQRRNAISTIPCGGSFMNFSPGQPFLPGEREANLKIGQPPLKDILGPKSPTDSDIEELVEEVG